MIVNAKIKSTQLKLEQDNSFCLVLELSTADKTYFAKTQNVSLSLIKQILTCLELPSYEEIARKLCRIKIDDGKNRVLAIGHYLKDNWVELN